MNPAIQRVLSVRDRDRLRWGECSGDRFSGSGHDVIRRLFPISLEFPRWDYVGWAADRWRGEMRLILDVRVRWEQKQFDPRFEWCHNGTIMVNFTLKDIPDDLHDAFRRRAETNGRSLNKEIIATLNSVAFSQLVDISAHLGRASRLRGRTETNATLEEIEAAVEEGR